MNVYQFEDLIIGETMDPQLPAYIAIGDNIIKGTISDYIIFDQRVSNQRRRFARQSQVKEIKHHGRS
jgi:hypothetical protein